ncbi:metallophosphoesterase [Aquibacillus sp. 3ASR75-11]|uniref:Phosphoesterase n=1 Tax=Terrihalobacillus insolitus TaxID=2950438 RepID=A0A9X3WQ91_9BACI|nr:metallophosphoesterase [Terrihalobacillus insolitus]MDC3412566.1 metallophosphoesterase [Terrihalobacillus insolitus]MDC3423917.1 metallophosphoesterase [Terrihalobacillus insolitus]
MSKVLIMSDSHGLTDDINRIRERHVNEVDGMIHCGDSELDNDSDALYGFHVVAGNCDFDPAFKNEIVFNMNDRRFLVTHGHLHNVKTTLMSLYDRAEQLGAAIVCYGHTHAAGTERIKDCIFINPGSVRLPRGRKEKTYAIASWSDSHTFTVDYFTTNGESVEELSFQTTFE